MGTFTIGTTRLQTRLTTLLLVLLVGSALLSTPSVSAQRGPNDAAANCRHGGYRTAYAMINGVPVGFANPGECIHVARDGGLLFSSLTGTLVEPRMAFFEGSGLLPGAPITISYTRADNSTATIFNTWAILPNGTTSGTTRIDCDPSRPEVVSISWTSTTASGAPITGTVEIEPCL